MSMNAIFIPNYIHQETLKIVRTDICQIDYETGILKSKLFYHHENLVETKKRVYTRLIFGFIIYFSRSIFLILLKLSVLNL